MRPRTSHLLLGPVLAAALVACGGDDDGAASDGDGGLDGDSTTLTVGALDSLEFDAEAYQAEVGTIDVVYENEGSVAHTLLIEGVDDFKLSVGRTDRGSVELEPGTYELYCDVAGHREAGMVAELTVE